MRNIKQTFELKLANKKEKEKKCPIIFLFSEKIWDCLIYYNSDIIMLYNVQQRTYFTYILMFL